MRYIVELKKGKSIVDLCYAVNGIGRVIPSDAIQQTLRYIEEQTSGMPLNGCKLRLLEIKEMLGGKSE